MHKSLTPQYSPGDCQNTNVSARPSLFPCSTFKCLALSVIKSPSSSRTIKFLTRNIYVAHFRFFSTRKWYQHSVFDLSLYFQILLYLCLFTSCSLSQYLFVKYQSFGISIITVIFCLLRLVVVSFLHAFTIASAT